MTGTSCSRQPFLIQEPADAYHARSSEYLSSHQLADFRKSPLLYHRRRRGLFQEEVRPAYLVGRAAHTLILEGREQFDREYAVGGPINPKTGKPFGQNTKAFDQWAQSVGKPVLTHRDFELLVNMEAGVLALPRAAQLLAEGEAEGVLRTDYCDMPCQIRLDWFHPREGIVDLKTCDDLTWFEADAKRFGYDYQMAFYRAVFAQATGEEMPVHIIAIEKKEPFRCGTWKLGENQLAIRQQENEAAIERLKNCLENDTWPTGYEETRVFEI